jgi:hypothetical protein
LEILLCEDCLVQQIPIEGPLQSLVRGNVPHQETIQDLRDTQDCKTGKWDDRETGEGGNKNCSYPHEERTAMAEDPIYQQNIQEVVAGSDVWKRQTVREADVAGEQWVRKGSQANMGGG